MIKAKVEFTGVSPYSQSKYIAEKKTKNETHEEFDRRIWKERCHWNDDGVCFIPPMAFKNCLSEAAKYKSIKIPGKGQSTYTKHFESGVMVVNPVVLPGVTRETIQCEVLHLPSDGRRGGTKRVEKHMPLILKWGGSIEFLIFDELISEEVFQEHLSDAGSFIGLGRFRPRNNGFYGRFSVDRVQWGK